MYIGRTNSDEDDVLLEIGRGQLWVVTILQNYECCVVAMIVLVVGDVDDDGAMSMMAKMKGVVVPLYVYFEAIVYDHGVVAAAAAAVGFVIVAVVTFVVSLAVGGVWSLATTMRKRSQ